MSWNRNQDIFSQAKDTESYEWMQLKGKLEDKIAFQKMKPFFLCDNLIALQVQLNRQSTKPLPKIAPSRLQPVS